MLQCHHCGVSIVFDPDPINKKTGKKIPIDRQTERPHDCPKRPTKHYLSCKRCNFEIYFDDNVRSANGKAIPLDVNTGDRHVRRTHVLYSLWLD